MEEDSGCRIKVSRDGNSDGLSSVELSGSRGSISDAKQRIKDAGVEIVKEGGGESKGRGWWSILNSALMIYIKNA